VLLGDYFEEDQLAAELGVTRRTLRMWRLRHTGPPWGRIGKRTIYNIAAVKTWLEGRDRPQRGRRAP
jgi:hypothetical protein